MVADILYRISGAAILAAGGWGVGDYVADVWAPGQYLALVLGSSLAGAIIGLVSTPFVVNRISGSVADQTGSLPTSRLLSGIVGLTLGLFVALLISIPIFRLPGWLGLGLPVAISLVMAYIGATLMLSPSRDIFHKVLPDSGAQPLANGGTDDGRDSSMLLDTSAIIDGRIAAIAKTGFLQGTLMAPRFILDELRHVADSRDPTKRARGRRGLEMLREIREEGKVRTEILDLDYAQAVEVDAKLIGLARQLGASIVTTDFKLNRVARIDGITVLNVNELANAMRPVALPGERMRLRIQQEGKEPGQGVGFLEDGTMVVVDSGVHHIDRELEVTVARVLQTASGVMIFANPS